jgi:TusA-related sulfurtransferase
VTTMMRTLAIGLAAAAIGCMGGGRGHAKAPARAAEPAEPPAEAAAPPAEATAPPAGAAASGPAAGPMAGCPMAVPGTEVAADDVPAGEAITFTTADPQAVADLRSRVHAMAEMHEAHHGAGMMGGMHGPMHHGDMAGGGMERGGTGGGTGSADVPEHGMMPGGRAVAEDVPGGARLVITADDPADVDRVRAAVRMHAAHMRDSGTCGMELERPGAEQPGSR